MLRFITKKNFLVSYKVVLIAFIFLTASCSGSVTPKVEQTPPNISPSQVTDWPVSTRKIEAGQHLRFDHISLEQGLSQSTVFCMLQDSQGFMWFGTEDGLNKYDGYNFTIYKHDSEDPNSLSDDWIEAMLVDSSGTLWIGTRQGGLDRYDIDLDHFTQYQNDPENPSSLSDNEITTLFQDQEGVLWIGTGSGGVNRFDQENGRFIIYQHDPNDSNSLSSNRVSVIYEDQDGALWIGTEGGGLNRFERENDGWRHYIHDSTDPHSLRHNTITAISEDQSGTLWVGTGGGGLERYDQENDEFIHYQHDADDHESLSSNDISAIYNDREGILWIGTRDEGLNRLDPEKEGFSHFHNVPVDQYSLSSSYISSIFQDRESVLWFGTIGSGINKLDPGRSNFALYQNDPNDPNSLGDNMVRAFYQDEKGPLWIGTMFGGLDRFDRETGKWHHYRHDPDNPNSLSDDFVSAIYRDRSDVLWIGTLSGLDRIDPVTEKVTRFQPEPDAAPGAPSNKVRTIYESQTGDFWIGTNGGLYRFDRKKESWGHPYRHEPGNSNSLSDDRIFSFLEDRQGRIWIGTFGGGLNRFDPGTDTFTHYQNDPDDPLSLSNNIVISIFQDREGTLWISTPGGLEKFDPATDEFTHYREKDGMASESVNCAIEDGDGYIWLSTIKGLLRFDPQGETFRNYDITDGLQSNEFNGNACLKNDSGEILFGGINGFNTFFPDQVQDNPTIPPVVLTSLVQDGEDVNLGMAIGSADDVTFKWPDNAFEFEFAVLSFAHPEKNQYAYYLEGFEESWNEVGTRRYGQYTNLPGGTYTLRLIGSNNDGVWNEVGHALKITIVPPIWQTWWFRGTAVFLLLGVAFFGYRQRIKNIESRSRNLEMQVKERTAELQWEIDQRTQIEEVLRNREMEKAVADERSRLARELHDSVTQSLYSLTLFTEAARHMAEEEGLQTIEQYIGQIGIIGLQALKEMRLLVFELRPPELEKEGLVSALRRRLEAVESRAGVDARVVVDEIFKLPRIVEQEFFRIAQEALNNALKHAAAASVVVYLRQENGSIEMEIVDDGVGFDPQSLPDRGGMGLKSIRERVEQLSGTVAIQSKPGDGTSIKITIEDLENAASYAERS